MLYNETWGKIPLTHRLSIVHCRHAARANLATRSVSIIQRRWRRFLVIGELFTRCSVGELFTVLTQRSESVGGDRVQMRGRCKIRIIEYSITLVEVYRRLGTKSESNTNHITADKKRLL